jgi:hypothetical protein
MPVCHHDVMTALTVRLPDDEHTALRLLALRRGCSVNQLITELVRGELAREAPAEAGQSPQERAAAILARAGIDPASAEHRAAAAKARAALGSAGRARPGAA